jgi:chemotaxis protein CheZ
MESLNGLKGDISPAINPVNDEILNRIGHVTRTLHDNLLSLSFDKVLEGLSAELPDFKDRLEYVARMTEQAADRVLNLTDIATPLQSELCCEAVSLEKYWKQALTNPEFQVHCGETVERTLGFIALANSNALQTKSLLMDIMMAQDFQDLTGQVIKRMTTLVQDLEQQLVQVLIDFSPHSLSKTSALALMNGPHPNPTDAPPGSVVYQAQVDELLEKFGF